MIDIRLLEDLVAFADAGTLSAAADELHTSQPALTRSMKKLETDLGVPLFHRTKNRLELNETGEVAARHARRVLDEDRYFQERVIAFDRSLHTISIGYCAPIPQRVLTPLINSVFEGMTISADMADDADFLDRLRDRTYQLAVLHEEPEDEEFTFKKCGHEDLYVSVPPSDPLTFYPQLHLSDLSGRSFLLLSRIGFWRRVVSENTTDTNYLLQVEEDSFRELATNSGYPSFSSSYYLRRGQNLTGHTNIKIADDVCHTDYYLVCLESEYPRFAPLFDKVRPSTVI